MSPQAPDEEAPRADSPSAPAPDLILQVNVTQDQGKTALVYRLLAPTGKVAFHLEPFRGPLLDGSPDAFAAMLFEKIESLNECLGDEDDTLRMRNAEKELADLGRELYRKLFPPEMRAAYRKFRGVVETIQIASDEPWIPWELVKPYDDEVRPVIDDDFLCCQFQLTRWLAGDKVPAPSFFVGRMAVVGAENAPGSRPLPNAAKEHEMLAALASRHPGIEPVQLPEATFDDLVNLLRRGGLGILHFIGHGDARAERPDDAKIVLKDHPFRSYNLSGDLETAIKDDQPLVFLNACRVARQGWSLSGLGGWAEAWVRTCGCGAFVGPQWVVKDSLAFEFARVFYESLEVGKTFGQSISAAREGIRKKDPGRPTWLAYAAYGNPGARLLLSKAKEAPRASSEPSAPAPTGLKSSSPYSESSFPKRATRLGALILLALLAAIAVWKLWPIATPKLPEPSPTNSVKPAPVNPEQRSKRSQQEASAEKRSSAQEPPSRKAPSEAPRMEPVHPSEKSLTETKPIPGSPAPQKDVEKHSEPDSNVAELAKVEVIDVGGNKSVLEITSSWNDMVSEVRGMASASWTEKLLLTNNPAGDIYQIPWLEIPLHPFRRSNILEFRVIDKPLILKAKQSGRDLTFYPVKIFSASGNIETGYYWNAFRIEGKCTLGSGLQIDCQFPASTIRSIVFLQNAAAQNSSQKPQAEGRHKPLEATTARVPGDPSATDHTVLEIVDLEGKSVLLSDPSIAYPGGFGPSSMTEGIAVRRGIEESTLLWSGIRMLKFKSRQKKNDKGATVWRYAVDATLEDGRVVNVELRDDWNMAYMGGGGTGLLLGQTDLGKTSIPFSKISLLRVLKHAQAKK